VEKKKVNVAEDQNSQEGKDVKTRVEYSNEHVLFLVVEM